jgi:hypothetical protein
MEKQSWLIRLINFLLSPFAPKEQVAEKAGSIAIAKNPAYTSQLLAYRDEFIFTDCGIRGYWDEIENLWVDRDINAAINLKRVGLDEFPTIKRRRGNPVVSKSTTNSTSKEVLATLRSLKKPALYATHTTSGVVTSCSHRSNDSRCCNCQLTP